MDTTPTEERSTLHGTGALALGVLGMIFLLLVRWTGPGMSVLFGALGITVGVIGLASKDAARMRCAAGIVTGAIAFLLPVVLVTLMYS